MRKITSMFYPSDDFIRKLFKLLILNEFFIEIQYSSKWISKLRLFWDYFDFNIATFELMNIKKINKWKIAWKNFSANLNILEASLDFVICTHPAHKQVRNVLLHSPFYNKVP